MENNIFIYSPDEQDIKFERFHICVWEFRNGTSIIEIGGEIKHDCLTNLDQLSIYLYIPWINNNHKVIDLYDNLKNPENSRFIFNDSVIDTKSLDGGIGIGGVIHSFVSRDRLCILPIQPDDIIDSTNKIVKLSLNSLKKSEGANVYFRFYIENDIKLLSTRKTGITHSTIIYDFKINEKRNLYGISNIVNEKALCDIASCFFLNIIPNSYELNFVDNTVLKSIRTLEYPSFTRYLGDKRVKKDEHIVVFHKKENKDSYNFFIKYSKERIGMDQIALAISISLLSGLLLYMPSYKKEVDDTYFSVAFWGKLPPEVVISTCLVIIVLLYFFIPFIVTYIMRIIGEIKKFIKETLRKR